MAKDVQGVCSNDVNELSVFRLNSRYALSVYHDPKNMTKKMEKVGKVKTEKVEKMEKMRESSLE